MDSVKALVQDSCPCGLPEMTLKWQVLTVNPSLVTCLKLQHRAAPTERNLVNALRVATGDWKVGFVRGPKDHVNGIFM